MVFCFFFFFFRQKTAYEMRISDWSADVCSSDLLGFTIGFGVDGIFVMTLALVLEGVVSVESAVIAGGLMIALRRFMEIVTAPIGGIQIGRASCRERVCQYG